MVDVEYFVLLVHKRSEENQRAFDILFQNRLF